MTKTRFYIVIWAIVFCLHSTLSHALEQLSDDEMSRVEGQAGISVMVQGMHVSNQIEHMEFIDPDTDEAIEFDGFSLEFTLSSLTLMDIKTVTDTSSPYYGKTYLSFVNEAAFGDLWGEQGLDIAIDQVTVDGQEIGAFALDGMKIPGFWLDIGAQLDGGIAFDAGIEATIEEIALTYNTNGDALSFSGVYLADTITGDAATPSAWTSDGSFTVGFYEAGNPATVDILSDGIGLNLPMAGSMGIENVGIGGNDFGPVLINNLNMPVCDVNITNSNQLFEYWVSDNEVTINLGITVQTYATVDSIKMGYYDNGSGYGWDQDWENVTIGSSSSDPLVVSGITMQFAFDNMADGDARQLVTYSIGSYDVSGEITADMNSFSDTVDSTSSAVTRANLGTTTLSFANEPFFLSIDQTSGIIFQRNITGTPLDLSSYR